MEGKRPQSTEFFQSKDEKKVRKQKKRDWRPSRARASGNGSCVKEGEDIINTHNNKKERERRGGERKAHLGH